MRNVKVFITCMLSNNILGALISIGDSYFFRFNNDSTNHPQPSPKPFQQASNSNSTADRLYPDESPYAVVNNRGEIQSQEKIICF